MRIFVFEFITGGGWHSIDPEPTPSGSLLLEGRAMVESIAKDFAAIEGTHVVRLVDARLNGDGDSPGEFKAILGADELRKQFADAAANADFTLVIAPEFDDHLLDFAELAIKSGGTLLSPSPGFIRLTANKHRTAQWLANARVPVPHGLLLSPGETVPDDFPFPAVLKPIDGAGSLDVRRVDSVAQLTLKEISTTMRLEHCRPGTPVSVAVICGRHGVSLLPPCLQKLSTPGDFAYLGGECPIDLALAQRASRLARLTMQALPRSIGYIGIDLVLGEDPTGSEDVVIEVNPRLTTSYVGLRRLVEQNLAAAMLQMAQGQAIELSLRPGRVEFSADGTVHQFAE